MPTGILSKYPLRPGAHPLTAGLRNLFEYHGAKSTHTRKVVSEPLLLGMGGGLGFGFGHLEIPGQDRALILLGFDHSWRRGPELGVRAVERIGGKATLHETTGDKMADKHLRRALDDGRQPIAWVDQAQLPYRHMPRYQDGCFPWQVTVLALDDEADVALVDDVAERPVVLLQEELAAARSRVRGFKHRLLVAEAPSRVRPEPDDVRAAIGDCLETLRDRSGARSVHRIEALADLVVDRDEEFGWARLHRQGRGLYSVLRSLYEGVVHQGTDGHGLRQQYAAFLDEAAKLLGVSALRSVAARYRDLAEQWRELADAALPEAAIPLANTRILLDRKYELIRTKGSDATVEVNQVSEDIEVLARQQNEHLALSDPEVGDLLDDLRDRLLALYEGERDAAETLASLEL
ncbi:MAG: BtrH N-terminal domain-containing protein [Myxococcota bacterium]